MVTNICDFDVIGKLLFLTYLDQENQMFIFELKEHDIWRGTEKAIMLEITKNSSMMNVK